MPGSKQRGSHVATPTPWPCRGPPSRWPARQPARRGQRSWLGRRCSRYEHVLREGSGGFDSRRHDRDPSPSPASRGAARGGFGSGRHNGTSSPSPAASGGAARGFERDPGDPEERGRIWKKTDFPTVEALCPCRVKRHEDLPRHIYLLLDILGLQFRWLLTRVGMAARSSPQKNTLWTTTR